MAKEKKAKAKVQKFTLGDFANASDEWHEKDVKDVFKEFITYLEDLPVSSTVTAHGLGTFTKKKKPPRNARNPRTGETIKVPAKVVVTFKAAAALRDM